MKNVVLWDIDGTLLTTARSGIHAWEYAIECVLKTKCDLSQLHTAGLTDVEIAGLLMSMHGAAPDPEAARRIVGLYEQNLPECLPRRQGRVFPGVVEALDDLEQRTDVVCLLLTGNTRAGARAKLAHYGLSRYFRDGAFGDDALDRVGVARRAAEVARSVLGQETKEVRMFVIGDTPHDVRCGKAIGAHTIAVATGAHSADELRSHTPWRTIEQIPGGGGLYDLLQTAQPQATGA